MRSGRLRILIGVVLVFALLGWTVYLFGNTRLSLRGSSLEDGSLTFETQFPNASCRKVVILDFPFVKLECEKLPDPP